jgi:Na+/proline symporter
MLLYTYRGGIKTLVWTDSFQSFFLVLGVVLSIVAIVNKLDIPFSTAISNVFHSEYTETFFWDWKKPNFFFKEFLGGIFIAVAMTGLDQNMMQKNLSCKTLGEAQKNIFWFSVIMVIVNIIFLSLGALLYIYYNQSGIEIPINPETQKIMTDKVFPNLALNHLGIFAGLVFIIGLTAATFSSADSVLTTLTTSFYIDILEYDKNEKLSEQIKTKRRTIIHILFAFILWLVILFFDALNQKAIIDSVLMLAGYTYGPLLGLFTLGLFTKLKINDKLVPVVCIIAPVITYLLSNTFKSILGDYQIGNELILINAGITILLLSLVQKRRLA